MGAINWLRFTTSLSIDESINLFQTLQGNSNFNYSRYLTAEPERVNTCKTKTVRCICGLN
jgi:hypothetical protein